MDNRLIAQKLVELRGAKSRQEVANALHISLSAIGMYETGKRIPRDDIKERFARYYGIPVSYIFFDEHVTDSDQK